MKNKQHLKRRSFIKCGVTVAAAAGIPSIVPNTVFGNDAPSNRVHVGQIGCGGISNYHTNYLRKMKDVRVIAVCDAFETRRKKKAAEYNGLYGDGTTRIYADFRELLSQKDIDAVIVAAHDNWHTPMSIAAAKAGKDVYCQKPLALDFSLTSILRKVVNEKERVFQFGTQFRSMERWRTMCEVVRNGHIGKLEKIDVWSRNVHFDARNYRVRPYGSTEEVPVPKGFNYDAWQGPSPMVPYTVDRCTNWGGYHCPETSLGFITACGIHPLGIAQWGNNSDDTSPIRYEGTGKMPEKGIFRTLEKWDVKCTYEDGVELRLMDSRTAMPEVKKYYKGAWREYDGVVFRGSTGWIGGVNNGFAASDHKLWRSVQGEDKRLPVSPEHNRNFIDCVKSRKETICPVEMAIRCDTIGHLARAAALTDSVVNWDPAKEQVVDNDAASKLLSLPYREKWKVW